MEYIRVSATVQKGGEHISAAGRKQRDRAAVVQQQGRVYCNALFAHCQSCQQALIGCSFCIGILLKRYVHNHVAKNKCVQLPDGSLAGFQFLQHMPKAGAKVAVAMVFHGKLQLLSRRIQGAGIRRCLCRIRYQCLRRFICRKSIIAPDACQQYCA